MKCFRCLLDYQSGVSGSINAAEYVYSGESLCRRHINIVRGHPAHFDRYEINQETP